MDASKRFPLSQTGKSSTVASPLVAMMKEIASVASVGFGMSRNYVADVTSTQPLCSSQPLLSPQIGWSPALFPATSASNPSPSLSLQSTTLSFVVPSQVTPTLTSLNTKGHLPSVMPVLAGAGSRNPERQTSFAPFVSESSPIKAEDSPPLFESPSSCCRSGPDRLEVSGHGGPKDVVATANVLTASSHVSLGNGMVELKEKSSGQVTTLSNQPETPRESCPSVSPLKKDLDDTLTPPMNPSKTCNLIAASSDTSTVVKTEHVPTVSKKNVRYARKLTYGTISEHRSDDDSNGEDFKTTPSHFNRLSSGKTPMSHMNMVITI